MQLHPILKGERRDLGHPDEAGGLYALLELIGTDFTQDPPPLINKLKELIGVHRLKTSTEETTPNYAHTTFLFVLANQIKEYENIKIREIVPCDIKEGFMQFMNLGTPKGKERGHGIYITKEQVEAEKEAVKKAKREAEIKHILANIKKNLELHQDKHTQTYPAFLKPQAVCQPANEDSFFGELEKVDKKQTYSPPTRIQPDNNNTSKDTLAARAAEIPGVKQVTPRYASSAQEEVIDNSPLSKVKIGKEAEVTIKKTVDGNVAVPSYGTDNPAHTTTHIEGIEGLKEGKQEVISTSNVNTNLNETRKGIHTTDQPIGGFDFTRDWVLPHGLRSFHSHMLTYTYPLRSVKTH